MASFFIRNCKVCGRKFLFEKGCQFCKKISKKELPYLIKRLPTAYTNDPLKAHEKRMSWIQWLSLLIKD